jgi:hypothetical protein
MASSVFLTISFLLKTMSFRRFFYMFALYSSLYVHRGELAVPEYFIYNIIIYETDLLYAVMLI